MTKEMQENSQKKDDDNDESAFEALRRAIEEILHPHQPWPAPLPGVALSPKILVKEAMMVGVDPEPFGQGVQAALQRIAEATSGKKEDQVYQLALTALDDIKADSDAHAAGIKTVKEMMLTMNSHTSHKNMC